jgi:YbgC/YbaW family acyl-CoA thioester hydrolase
MYTLNIPYKTFESELRVRPDDIDMFKHVHNSKYFDYVLAARYEQMDTCYGMSMEHFMEQGFGWLVKAAQVNYKRALTMGDYFIVQTGIDVINERECRIKFNIIIKDSQKLSSDGWFEFTMIDMATGKAVKIPKDIVEHYSIPA